MIGYEHKLNGRDQLALAILLAEISSGYGEYGEGQSNGDLISAAYALADAFLAEVSHG